MEIDLHAIKCVIQGCLNS